MTVLRNLLRDLGQTLNKLNTSYFSVENMEAIQNSIISNVYNFSKEKFKIDRQSDQEVGIAMREIWRQYCEYPQIDTNENIQIEINRLNDILVQKAVVAIIKRIRVHQKYLKDKNTGYSLNDRPEPVGTAGGRLSNPNNQRSINNIGVPHTYPVDFSNLPW